MTWFGWFMVACYTLTVATGRDERSRWIAVAVLIGLLVVGTGTGL